MAEVAKVEARPMRNRPGRLVNVVVTDGRGQLSLTFFNQAWRAKQLDVGMRGLFAGRVGTYRGRRQLINPQTQLLDPDEDESSATGQDFLKLIPVYPATAAMPTWNIARAVRVALDVVELGEDPMPADVRGRHDLVELAEALRLIHRPDNRDDVARATRRLKWDEAFVLQVVLAQRRAAAAARPAVPRRAAPGGLLDGVRRRLPFPLTDGPAGGRRGDRGRPARAASDAPPAAGRGRLGQDRRRAAGDAAGRRQRGPGGAARADRGARRSSTPGDRALLGPARPGRRAGRGRRRDAGRPADRLAGGGGAARRPGRGGRAARRASSSGPTPCSSEGVEFADLGAGRRRRAAPLRRGAAGRPARQGRHPAARARHDRDAHPAHRRDDGLRRPGDLHADRAARRAGRRSRPTSCRSGSNRPWLRPRLGAGARGGRRGPAGLRRVPAHRRRRGRRRGDADRRGRPAGRPRRPSRRCCRCCADGPLPGCASRCCTAGCPPRRRTT